MAIIGSRIKGWISLAGGIGFIVMGVVALEPLLVALGIVITLGTWGTFVLEKKIRDRYK